MNEETKNKLDQIINFRKIIFSINNELYSKGIYDCEYMLINNSIEDVIHVLENESQLYNLVMDDVYSNGVAFRDFLEKYFECVKRYYNSLEIKGKDNDTVADKYYKKMKEPVSKYGEYIIHDKADIDMNTKEIYKTLLLMKEAVQVYYKLYHNMELVAQLSTNEKFTFHIQENKLLHLLGVTPGQLKQNPDFIRLVGDKAKCMSSVDILEWILTDIGGNQDLLQYSEDFLKRIASSKEFKLTDFQKDSSTQLLNYYKIRAKSQTFLKYGPYKEVSMVAKLGKDSFGNQKTLSQNSESTVAMVSHPNTFKKYPWAYFGLVNNGNDSQYIETLQIDNSENKKKLFNYSKPAIVTKVGPVSSKNPNGSGDPGEPGGRIFSLEEQFDLFCTAYDEFKTQMDFTDLIEYFERLINSRSNEIQR